MLKTFFNSYFLKKEPFTLIHYITNRCNAACKHCFIDFSKRETGKNELTLKEIEELSKHLGNSLFNVNLTGGEPFLREDIFEIAKIYFENTTIKSMFITTNGTYTMRIQKFIEDFIRLGIKKNVIFSISIDDFEEEHDRNRNVAGLYQKALSTYKMIEAYHNENIIANIAITVTSHNYDRVLELYAFLKEIGIKAVVAILMREAGVVKEIENKKQVLDAYLNLTRKIQQDQLQKSMAGFGGTFQGILMNCKNIILYKIIPRIYLHRQFVVNCVAGRLFGVIYADGVLHPCEILGHPLGNLRDYQMDFMQLWKNKSVRNFCKMIRSSKCTCTFECVWTINIISDFRFVMPLLYNYYKLKWGS